MVIRVLFIVGAWLVGIEHNAMGACVSEPGIGELVSTDFENSDYIFQTECDDGVFESLTIDSGNWVDAVRAICSEDPENYKFMIGRKSDNFQEGICEGTGGIASMSATPNGIYLSDMTVTCVDGSMSGPYGHYHDTTSEGLGVPAVNTSCNTTYQYASGFRYYQPEDIVLDCTISDCEGGAWFSYLQLVCTDIADDCPVYSHTPAPSAGSTVLTARTTGIVETPGPTPGLADTLAPTTGRNAAVASPPSTPYPTSSCDSCKGLAALAVVSGVCAGVFVTCIVSAFSCYRSRRKNANIGATSPVEDVIHEFPGAITLPVY